MAAPRGDSTGSTRSQSSMLLRCGRSGWRSAARRRLADGVAVTPESHAGRAQEPALSARKRAYEAAGEPLFLPAKPACTCFESLAGAFEFSTSLAKLSCRRFEIPAPQAGSSNRRTALNAEPDFLAMATKLGAVLSLPKPSRHVDGCLAGKAASAQLPRA